MSRRLGACLIVLIAIVAISPAANADAPATPPPVAGCGGSVDGCGGDSGTISVGGTDSQPGSPGSSGSHGKPVDLPGTVKVYSYAPTCSGNTRESGDVLCGGAVNTCQPVGTGLVRFWVWMAEVDRKTGAVLNPPGWVLQPGSVCLGPDSPGLPAKAAIAGILARDFKNLVVVKGVAHVDPNGSTLVNFDNGFWTDARSYALPAVQILGHTVVVTAKPEKYDWYFGDGASAMDAGPGRHGTTDVEHTYTDTGVVKPYVVITWSGTYTVDGGAPLDVIGTATTTGDGTPLQVKQAKAQLVSK